MKRATIIFTLLGFPLAPSFGFVQGTPSFGSPLQTKINHATKTKQHQPPNNIRGGTAGAGEPLMAVPLADYSGAAKALFGNILGPASMISGGLVPLGFLAGPLPDDGKKWKKKAQCLYMALSVASLVNELLAIMYATVATNKLTEVASAPTTSVFALIKRDYELPWVATNVHFMLGLLGFCSMIMLRALCIYPAALNVSSAGLALSALVGMVSIVNVGVAEGDGQGQKLGGNILSLGIRYLGLLTKSITEKKSPLQLASIVLFVYFAIKTIQTLMHAEA